MGGTHRSRQQDDSPFSHKPGLNELLRVIGLDVSFHRASGDLLYYRDDDDQDVEVVDLVGGYGTLLFGHNQPALITEATRFLTSGQPNHTQGSIRGGAERLARVLTERAEGDFCVLFGNSGTEAVEASLKHALLETGGRTLIALEGAFHGKTLGSLQLTANPQFREPFATASLDVVRVRPNDLDHLQAVFCSATEPAGFLVEPVQGEAGIRPLSAAFMQQAAALCRERSIPFIADECQSGLGRTGTFLASHALGVQPDYVILAKALGGGLAKVSALLIRRDRYQTQFDLLHSSTLADDEFSCAIALKVLELLDAEALQQCRSRGTAILSRLQKFRRRYPEILCDVRGSGLMLGVELQRPSAAQGYLLQFLSQQHLLGPLVCGCLLHEHGIRVATTLSDPFTLRIQPSVAIADELLERFYTALDDVCGRLQRNDLTGLTRFLASPTSEVGTVPELPAAAPHKPGTATNDRSTPRRAARRRRVAWLFHFIDEDDLVHLEPALAGSSPQHRKALLERTAPLVEPVVLEAVDIQSANGGHVRLQPIVLPVTSDWLLRRRTGPGHKTARALVQQGVDVAATLGCGVVTLGQFTSIVTRGGRQLHDRGVCLTSGNSYTAALIVQSLNGVLSQRGLDRRELTLAIIGAAGDIGRTCTAMLASRFRRSLLVGTRNAISHRRLQRLVDQTPGSELATDLAQIRCADVVVCATSSVTAPLSLDLLHRESIVCDVSVPGMFTPTRPVELQGRTILPGAIVRLPGSEDLGIPGFPLEQGLTYGCMAEGLLLGLEGIDHRNWQAPSLVQQAWRMAEIAQRHGFRAAEHSFAVDPPEKHHACSVCPGA